MHRIIARTARAARLHYTNYELWKPRVYMHMYTRVGGAPWGVPTAAPVVGVVHLFRRTILPWRSLFYGFFADRSRPTITDWRRLPKTTHALPAGVVLLVR